MRKKMWVICFLLVLFVVIPPTARGQWRFQRLTNNTGDSEYAKIAINGSSLYVVWQDDTYGDQEVFLKKSTDAGLSWSFQRLTNNTGNSQVPDVDVWGDIHVVWDDNTLSPYYEIYYKKSTDDGSTWSFQRLTTNSGVSSGPRVAVWDSDIHVVWQDNTYDAGNFEIFYKHSTDNGATWSFQRLTSNAGISIHPVIAVSGSNIHVVWEDFTYNSVASILYKRSTDNGATWSFQRLTTNSSSSEFPEIKANGTNINVVWSDGYYGNAEILYKKSTDNGSTWTFKRLSQNSGSSVRPAVGADSSDDATVVWSDNTYSNLDIFYKTASGPIWYWGRITNNSGASRAPQIEVTTGEDYVVWYDDSYGNNEILFKAGY